MTSIEPTAAPSAATGGPFSWPRRAADWLDSKGRGAWIAAMVLGFVFFWPVGLALVFYITTTNRWSKDMFNRSGCAARRRDREHWGHHHRAYQTSGNSAFDAYKTEMLKRLEDEQTAFEDFLQRLRAAKDKSEFDNFMEDRAKENRVTEVKTTESPRTGEY
jgi:Protein of unknown function (DUF2852)